MTKDYIKKKIRKKKKKKQMLTMKEVVFGDAPLQKW